MKRNSVLNQEISRNSILIKRKKERERGGARLSECVREKEGKSEKERERECVWISRQNGARLFGKAVLPCIAGEAIAAVPRCTVSGTWTPDI